MGMTVSKEAINVDMKGAMQMTEISDHDFHSLPAGRQVQSYNATESGNTR